MSLFPKDREATLPTFLLYALLFLSTLHIPVRPFFFAWFQYNPQHDTCIKTIKRPAESNHADDGVTDLSRYCGCDREQTKVISFFHICVRKLAHFLPTNNFSSAFRIRIHPDPLHLAGSGSTSIFAPDPEPLRFLFPDPHPLKTLIWIRVAPKQKKTI